MDTPIGIFDSGIGGLTVARAILDQLPQEQLVYLADTAHVPYGPKPIADVRRHALAGLDALAAAPQVTVTSVACPQFVDFVERGTTTGRALLGLASAYLEPLQRAEIDTLVLGCTHYPLLAGLIGLVMGDEVTLVSSADETARSVYRVLTTSELARPESAAAPTHRLLSTGDTAAFGRLAQRILGAELAGTFDQAGGLVGAGR